MDVEPAARPPFAVIAGVREVPDALAALGVQGERPVLVSVGGAGGMSEADRSRVEQVVREWLVPVLERHEAAVVDGGTDAGVMQMAGRAREACAARFPLVGVAAVGTVRLPGREPAGADAADLEPHHTGVVVVPGTAWGDESGWIADVARRLAGGRPSATLVINGGAITLQDVENSLAGQRPVLVVRGTGRTADTIAQAVADGAPPDDPRLAAIVASPLLSVVALADPAALAAAVDAALGRPWRAYVREATPDPFQIM